MRSGSPCPVSASPRGANGPTLAEFRGGPFGTRWPASASDSFCDGVVLRQSPSERPPAPASKSRRVSLDGDAIVSVKDNGALVAEVKHRCGLQ